MDSPGLLLSLLTVRDQPQHAEQNLQQVSDGHLWPSGDP